MSNLHHSCNDTEYRIIYTSVFLKVFKIDHILDDIIDILHDTQVKSFHEDIGISESDRKEEYPLSEVFTTNYFYDSNTRARSIDINKDGFIMIMHKIFNALSEKVGGFYWLSMTGGNLSIDFTMPDVDLTRNGHVNDSNYGLYRVIRDVNRMPEQQRQELFVDYKDEYSWLYRTTYDCGNLTLHFSMNFDNHPISTIVRFLSTMFDVETVRETILTKIN